MKQRLHPIELTLMIVAALALTSGAVALHTQSQLAEKVVRLHVLANSDSEEDQALKLKVRDAVLEQATETLRGADSQAEASRRLTDILPELEETARVVITANGYDYGVRAELAETSFPTKEYDGFALPAGEYLALRVLIGEAAGQNWWCVVFPPLCTTASSDVYGGGQRCSHRRAGCGTDGSGGGPHHGGGRGLYPEIQISGAVADLKSKADQMTTARADQFRTGCYRFYRTLFRKVTSRGLSGWENSSWEGLSSPMTPPSRKMVRLLTSRAKRIS